MVLYGVCTSVSLYVCNDAPQGNDTMEIQTGHAIPNYGRGRVNSVETNALLSLKDGESLLLPRRDNDGRGGWIRLTHAARYRGFKVAQRREGDFMRFWLIR